MFLKAKKNLISLYIFLIFFSKIHFKHGKEKRLEFVCNRDTNYEIVKRRQLEWPTGLDTCDPLKRVRTSAFLIFTFKLN